MVRDDGIWWNTTTRNFHSFHRHYWIPGCLGCTHGQKSHTVLLFSLWMCWGHYKVVFPDVSFLLFFPVLSWLVVQAFCITADNASNINAMCNKIKALLNKCGVYNFNLMYHCLPCLGDVLNLAITTVILVLTNISAIETTSSITQCCPALASWKILWMSSQQSIRLLSRWVMFSRIIEHDWCIIYIDPVQWPADRILPHSSRQLWDWPPSIYPPSQQPSLG